MAVTASPLHSGRPMIREVGHAPYIYFRRYSLDGKPSFLLNAALLFVVAFYVYPLEFLHLRTARPAARRRTSHTRRIGLIIVCGAPESGRATTIASLVNYLNTTSPTRRHCVLLEQPIEYLHRSQQWSLTQREVGSDTDTFEDGVRSAILQDADAIVIGAIEEPSVVEAAMRAVEALAEALRAIIGQKLIPRQSGGRRILATQLLFDTPYIRESILDAGSSEHLNDALMKGRDQYGTQTFDQSLADLVLSGHVAFAMAVKLASNPLDLELQLRGSR